MGIVFTCLICAIGGGVIAALLIWVAKMRPLDTRIAQLEQIVESSGIGEPLPVRVERLELFMRPQTGELAPRLAQLEQQQAVDSRAFAAQARIHHRRIGELDERMQYMARDIRSDRPTRP